MVNFSILAEFAITVTVVLISFSDYDDDYDDYGRSLEEDSLGAASPSTGQFFVICWNCCDHYNTYDFTL